MLENRSAPESATQPEATTTDVVPHLNHVDQGPRSQHAQVAGSNPAQLQHHYGAETPLKSLATLSTPDSQTIQIQPFDISGLAAIEKAIAMSELGFTPNNDGKVIRINVPPLTEERRKEFCKLASRYAEEGKVALRNLRRDAIDKVKKQEKDGDFSEDQSRDEQDSVQKVLDKFIVELEKHLAEKEAAILKV